MAMNKYGRASKLTTTPPADTQQQKLISETEYNDLKSENEGLEATYNKELDAYNKTMNLYKNGPASTNQQGGVKFDSGNLQSGQKATFSGGSGSAEKWNKATEEQIKSGKVVHISQLDKVTQDFLKGAGIGPNSDAYGTVKDVYVPKGTTIKSWKDLYGADFNPVEWDAADKAGKLKEYEIAKGIQGKTFMPKIDAYEKYVSPTAPVKPKLKPVPERYMPNKIEIKPITKIDQRLAVPEIKIPSATKWSNPEPTKIKKERNLKLTKEGGQDGRVMLQRKIKPGGKTSPSVAFDETTGEYAGRKGFRYHREERLMKSFYGPEGYSEMNDPNAAKDALKGFRKEKREYKKDSTADAATKKEAIEKLNKKKETARLANRAVHRGKLSNVSEDMWQEGKGSRMKYFTADLKKDATPGAMYGYRAAATSNRDRLNALNAQEKSISAQQKIATGNSEKNKLVKMAEENAVNRNSTSDRMKTFWGY